MTPNPNPRRDKYVWNPDDITIDPPATEGEDTEDTGAAEDDEGE